MSEHRIEVGDLGELSDMPSDDPRHEALASQPSARARLRAYRDFVSPGDVPASARLAEAEARLAETLEKEIGVPVPATEPSKAGHPAARARRRERHEHGSLHRWLLGSRWRPLVAVGAVLLVIVGAGLLIPRLGQRQEPSLRGSVTSPPGEWEARPGSTRGADGGLILHWSPAPTVERYVVTFLASDLSEIARVGVPGRTELALRPDSLPGGLSRGAAVLWRVTAYRGDDEIGRSTTSPVELP
jgi:hypothetical protein